MGVLLENIKAELSCTLFTYAKIFKAYGTSLSLFALIAAESTLKL